MTVVGPMIIGDIGSKSPNKHDYDTVSIEYNNVGAIIVSSSDTIYSSGDAGDTWSGPSRIMYPIGLEGASINPRGSSYFSPIVQRFNTLDGSFQGIARRPSYGGSNNINDLTDPVIIHWSQGGEGEQISLGVINSWSLGRNDSNVSRVKKPQSLASDYVSRSLERLGVRLDGDNVVTHSTIDNQEKQVLNNKPDGNLIPPLVAKDCTFVENARAVRKLQVRGRTIYEVYYAVSGTYGMTSGYLSGVYINSLDGWHQPLVSSTPYIFAFHKFNGATWRITADPKRLDGPIGRVVGQGWVELNGEGVNYTNTDFFSLLVDEERGNIDTNNYNDTTLGWQVRHCLWYDRLYRFLKKGGNNNWEFDDIAALGYSSIRRADCPPPSGGWVPYGDTRFVPTPKGLIALNIAIDQCKVNYWYRESDSWSGWETVYQHKLRCTNFTGSIVTNNRRESGGSSTQFPWGTGIGTPRSSPGEYVNMAVQQKVGGVNKLVMYRWTADIPPDNPVIINIIDADGSSGVLDASEDIKLEWVFSGEGQRQTAIRIERKITKPDNSTNTTYLNSSGNWSSSKQVISTSDKERIIPAVWGSVGETVEFRLQARNENNQWSGWSDPVSILADSAPRVTSFAVSGTDIIWQFADESRVASWRAKVTDSGGAAVYDSGLSSGLPPKDVGNRRGISLRGKLLNGRHTISVEWWNNNGLKSSAATYNFNWNLSLLNLYNRNFSALSFREDGGLVLQLDWPSTPRSYWVRKRLKDSDGNTVSQWDSKKYSGTRSDVDIVDYMVPLRSSNMELSIITESSSGGLSESNSVTLPELDVTKEVDGRVAATQLINLDNSIAYELVVSYIRGKVISNVKYHTFADGRQRAVSGYELKNPLELRVQVLPYGLQQSLERDVGKTFVLRTLEGHLEEVVLGDISDDHRAKYENTPEAGGGGIHLVRLGYAQR